MRRRAEQAAREAELKANPHLARSTLATESYLLDRIKRVRKQIDAMNSALDNAIESPGDGRAIKAITDALAKLQETERILSGRPLPGNRRPGKEPTMRAPATVTPLD
jgi:hypothetical protein